MGDVREELLHAMQRRILILDGGMGTLIQRMTPGTEDNESLNLTHPHVIRRIHELYIEAGADIIETNTFGANSITQAGFGMQEQAARMALEGARIARSAADAAPRKVWVAGSVSPTGKSLSLATDVSRPWFRELSFDELVQAYSEQIEALARGGVDFILAETCFDALNTKAAIYAAGRVAPQLPMIISVSVSDRSGRTLTGQTIEAFYTAVRHAPLIAFGINCGFGAGDLEPLLESVAPLVDCPVIFYPNAGLPNEMGQYDQTPGQMAAQMQRIAAKGLVNIAGGCCGTTPEHIRAVADAVSACPPRTYVPCDTMLPRLVVSGLECAVVDRNAGNLANVGERTNVAGSRKFARLIAAGAYEEGLEIAAAQIEGGADIIDINMDDAMLDSTVEMEKFLRCISNDPAVAKAALMIDSSNFDTVLTGLKNAQGRCIVNSISLKEGEGEFLRKARQIKDLGAAVIVMAFDEDGQATTYERKIEICSRAYHMLVRNLGFRPCDVIFDVNVLSIGTGIPEHARYGIDFIEAVRWIKANLPGALTSGGISNLSFAFRGNNAVREAMHSAFLYHASAAGLDMAIVNPSMLVVYDQIEPKLLQCVEDVIFDRRAGAVDSLISMAGELLQNADAKVANAAGQGPVQVSDVRQRLADAVVSGKTAGLEQDVLEALNLLGRPVDVIEGPLMNGMEKVGEMFGSGRMFLPQVVKSATVMRDAVAVLEPYMKADASRGSDRPRVVIATVKGDVHDIGKNITSIVLSCNGFDVVDLGVMVPEDTILDKAEEVGASIVAASGLITPSLARMEELCRKMTRRGMSIPLFIGGATTSALHTAVKLAPLYDHVFYGADASSSAVMAKRYISDPAAFEAAEHKSQREIQQAYLRSKNSTTPGRERVFEDSSYLRGRVFDDIPCRHIDVDEVMPWFDWRMLYAIWGFKYRDTENEQTLKLKEDALHALEHMKAEGGCDIRLAARFFECCTDGKDIIAESGDTHVTFPMLRQEQGSMASLCDFVAPRGTEFRSPMGIFAISVHRTAHKAGCDCGQCSGSDYESMVERSVRMVLAEAASSWLDDLLQGELPADRRDVKIAKPAAGYASCPDHTLKRDILALLPDGDGLGISFTESYAMIPDASICGFIFAHPQAGYPEIRHVSESSLDDYALRRGFTPDEAELFLSMMRNTTTPTLK